MEGAGLGLALSRALVEAMHGTISVDAARKQGCAFTIELQIVDSPGAALEPQDLISTIPAARSDDASTVLYIEDNPSNIRLMEHIFADWTHARLLVAMQGRIGLELAREHNPDVVLLDLHLPDIPGNEVLAEMKADEQLQGIPVIVISADATQDRVKALLAAGAMKYITKPLQVKELIEALDEVLRMKERANAA